MHLNYINAILNHTKPCLLLRVKYARVLPDHNKRVDLATSRTNKIDYAAA